MEEKHVLAIDAGTTGVRLFLFDRGMEIFSDLSPKNFVNRNVSHDMIWVSPKNRSSLNEKIFRF